MKAWKKGAAIGGLWGFFSFFGIFLLSIGQGHGPTQQPSFIIEIFLLPTLSLFYILENVGKIRATPDVIFFVIVASILIGALIGSTIGFVIEKFNQRRSSL